MKLRHDILTVPFEVNQQSLDIADEEQLFLLPNDEEETDEEILTGKDISTQRALAEKKQSDNKLTEVNRKSNNASVFAFGEIKENARLIKSAQTRHTFRRR